MGSSHQKCPITESAIACLQGNQILHYVKIIRRLCRGENNRRCGACVGSNDHFENRKIVVGLNDEMRHKSLWTLDGLVDFSIQWFSRFTWRNFKVHLVDAHSQNQYLIKLHTKIEFIAKGNFLKALIDKKMGFLSGWNGMLEKWVEIKIKCHWQWKKLCF